VGPGGKEGGHEGIQRGGLLGAIDPALCCYFHDDVSAAEIIMQAVNWQRCRNIWSHSSHPSVEGSDRRDDQLQTCSYQ
jgi:hypothetical protein